MTHAFRRRISLATIFAVYLLASACSAVIIDNDSPVEAQFAEGERLLQKDRYIEAVERFRILKSRYPYSKYAALATLKIGDAHFQEEAFIEAASAYKIFRELYPKHELASYALYRIGECHYNLIPGTMDRDLEPATSAIEAYSQLTKDYPAAAERKDAETKITELRGKLADREQYVGNFYFIREQYQAAASRYKYLMEKFPGNPYREEALYRLAFSFERIGEYRKAKDSLEELDGSFPNGKYSAEASKLKTLIAKSIGEEK